MARVSVRNLLCRVRLETTSFGPADFDLPAVLDLVLFGVLLPRDGLCVLFLAAARLVASTTGSLKLSPPVFCIWYKTGG